MGTPSPHFKPSPAPAVGLVTAPSPALRADLALPLILEEKAYWDSDLGQRDLAVALSRLRPEVLAVIDASGWPRSILGLALVESRFHPAARSRAGAVGMWQFMPATARDLGLTVNSRVDERLDPVRSTEAALAYLARLEQRFGSWPSAFLAYNGGQGRLGRSFERYLSSDPFVLAYSRVLPDETSDFLHRVLAATIIMAEVYGEEDLPWLGAPHGFFR